MIACENSGHSIPDDFPEVRKIFEAGVTTKPQKDYELSRYACYLSVQNGDPRKEVIALGQTYFAIQTYRQEVADHFNELDEDNKMCIRDRCQLCRAAGGVYRCDGSFRFRKDNAFKSVVNH